MKASDCSKLPDASAPLLFTYNSMELLMLCFQADRNVPVIKGVTLSQDLAMKRLSQYFNMSVVDRKVLSSVAINFDYIAKHFYNAIPKSKQQVRICFHSYWRCLLCYIKSPNG